jgi:hypothetical protein
MGWHINQIENTVKVPVAAALEILNNEDCEIAGVLRDYDFDRSAEDFVDSLIDSNGHFIFDSDHMEHMDFVWQNEVLEVLKKFKVKGDIIFNSTDGDNRGKAWCYRFDGNGNVKVLKSTVRKMSF